MKLNRDWFRAAERHVCRSCGVKLARSRDGALRDLGAKVHVIFLLENHSFYRINVCKQCVKSLDFASSDVVMSFWASDIYALDSLEAKKEMAKAKPLPGFYMIEDSKFSIEKLVAAKERFLNARKL